MHIKARLLLVDVHEVDFILISKLLTEAVACDYQIDWVSTMEEALQTLAKRNHDLCLVDHHLGRHTGFDLIRAAAHQGIGTPMVFMTGRSHDALDRQAMNLGAAAYIDKLQVNAADLDRILRYTMRQVSLVNDLLEHNEELLHMHRLTEIALSGAGLECITKEMAALISRATGFSMVSIEAGLPSGELHSLAQHGFPGGYPDALPDDAAFNGVCNQAAHEVLRTGRPYLDMGGAGCTGAGYNSAARHFVHGAPVNTLICLPFEQPINESSAKGTIPSGVLMLADHNHLAVDSSQVSRAATLANHIGTLLRTLHPSSQSVPGGTPRVREESVVTTTMNELHVIKHSALDLKHGGDESPNSFQGQTKLLTDGREERHEQTPAAPSQNSEAKQAASHAKDLELESRTQGIDIDPESREERLDSDWGEWQY